MLPGPTLIRQCSNCGKPIAQPTINSGNTIGARYWTDGRMLAPMLPDKHWLVKCPHCRAIVWIDDLRLLKEIDPWAEEGQSESPVVVESQIYHVPSVEEYIAFAASSELDEEQLRHVRMRAWWVGNDARREEESPSAMSEMEAANLRALAELLDENDDTDCIMKAEVMRELGLFDESLSLLDRDFPAEYSFAVRAIRDLAHQHIRTVREIVYKR